MVATEIKEPRRTRRPLREVWPAWREALFILGSLLVSAAVAAVTGWGSWGHIVHIGHSVGEPSADWLPVAIDGMMFNGTILVAVDRFRKRVARPWAVVSLWLGSFLTLAFNVASAWERGIWAMLIAVTYSVALLCTVEAVFHPSQTTIEEAMARREVRREAKAKAASGNAPVAGIPVPVVGPAVEPVASMPVEPVAVTPVQEPDPEPIIAELVPAPVRRPRRRQTVKGHAGTGATDAELDAAFEALTDRANGRPLDTAAVFVEPS